jgi:hypothetical protein
MGTEGQFKEFGGSTMRYQLSDQERHVKTIAIEEHFSTPMQRQKSSDTEFRRFYLSTRNERLGYNITDQLADLDE